MDIKKKYEYFNIRDRCRMRLVKYLEQVLNDLPKLHNPKILDIGCGTGVPTLWLAEKYTGTITAIDTDKHLLDFLEHKIQRKKTSSKIETKNVSFFDLLTEPACYDLILAEGFLNVVGFEMGFKRVIEKIKIGGYFIIHDEYKDNDSKIALIHKNNCKIVSSLLMDETIWWRDFYDPLEIEINKMENPHLRSLFINEKKEIDQYKKNPYLFKSIYYVVSKS
ncbi:MAG: methyltransferase domain-containing protein [Bacteroidales bacterium]|nr:methyltransferase domain-containing protein [Bacteroidales bacterium]